MMPERCRFDAPHEALMMRRIAYFEQLADALFDADALHLSPHC